MNKRELTWTHRDEDTTSSLLNTLDHQPNVKMGFIGVYKSLYDWKPEEAGELELETGDLLYILDKNSDDDWWKAKKKAKSDSDDEPTGLVPATYIEQVSSKALGEG